MAGEPRGALWDLIRYAEELEAGAQLDSVKMKLLVRDVLRHMEKHPQREKVEDYVTMIAGTEAWSKGRDIAFPPRGRGVVTFSTRERPTRLEIIAVLRKLAPSIHVVTRTPYAAAATASMAGDVAPGLVALDEEYRRIKFRGKSHTLTKNQAACVKRMDLARQRGVDEMTERAILRDISTQRLQQVFRRRSGNATKSSPLWGTLIVKGSGKDMFRLKID